MKQPSKETIQLARDLTQKAADDAVDIIQRTQDLMISAGITVADFPLGTSIHLGAATSVAAEGIRALSGMLTLIKMGNKGTLPEGILSTEQALSLMNDEALSEATAYGLVHALSRIKDDLDGDKANKIHTQIRDAVAAILLAHFGSKQEVVQ